MVLELPKILVLGIGSALIFLAGFFTGWTLPAASPPGDPDLLFQVSTFTSLSEGGYDGIVPVGELMGHGDLGLGTFDGLDGEMVVAGGTCYQVKGDGSVIRPGPSVMVPFAAVTRFQPDLVVPGLTAGNLTELAAGLEAHLPSRTTFWAIRMAGTFPYVKVRSVPAQELPYPPLAEALKEQRVFPFTNVSGTVVGFYTPASAGGVNLQGYHLHFITADGKAGGHVMDIATSGNTVELDSTPRLTLILTN